MRAAPVAGLAAVAGTVAMLFVATSSSASTCPAPTREGPGRPVGPVTVPTCTADLKPLVDIILGPQCDPGPCDPTAVAPSE